ncbi:MAG: hypothetical protein ACM30G_12245 [Micromonosporaceae bacterium]
MDTAVLSKQEAHALAGLADYRRALDDPAGARDLYRQATDLYTELGTPHDHRVPDELLALDTDTDC